MGIIKRKTVIIFVFWLIIGFVSYSFGSVCIPFKQIDPKKKEALLVKRVMECWKYQVKGDRKKMYQFYDPFFRARISDNSFANVPYKLSYSDPKLKEQKIDGNVADVGVEVTYWINNLKIKGHPVKIKKKKIITKERWLFIDGTWWREYRNGFTNKGYAVY